MMQSGRLNLTSPCFYEEHIIWPPNQFIGHPTLQIKTKRAIMRICKGLPRNPTPITFTVIEVETAISKTKPSKAFDLDGISMLMLKKLGIVRLSYLSYSPNSLLSPADPEK